MAKRLTNGEYLADWDSWKLHDWYAVEKLANGASRSSRLYVTPIRADAVIYTSRVATGYGLTDYLGEPCEPGEFGEFPFFHMVVISAEEARKELEGGCDA